MINCVKDLDKARQALQNLSARTSQKSQKAAIATVDEILRKVRGEGDKALISYTERFDGFSPQPLQIPNEILKEAWEQTPTVLKNALLLAKQRIEDFHQKQKPNDVVYQGIHGERLGRRWSPVKNAGIYVPGGKAAYPSTVLMNAIPAKVAGVERLIMASPANEKGELNKTVLAAAHLVGINELFRVGGAQAIAGMAFGTKTIPKVDVITGPGNLYVTLAKKAVYGEVGIDSLAGPSEVLIIADNTANVEQVAADMLAQAEHDPLAASILLTTEPNLANLLPQEIKKQLEHHPRAEICQSSLKNWGLIVICKSLSECTELSDLFAPEHLELLVQNPKALAEKVTNAGAIFLGHWSPEAVGDYLAGPNHTLPTSGTARFSGALSVETFLKHTSLIEFNSKAMYATSSAIRVLAQSEGLHSHAQSIIIRTKEKT